MRDGWLDTDGQAAVLRLSVRGNDAGMVSAPSAPGAQEMHPKTPFRRRLHAQVYPFRLFNQLPLRLLLILPQQSADLPLPKFLV